MSVSTRTRSRLIVVIAGSALLLCPRALPGEPVAVRYTEGLVHGFLALRTLDGTHVADGDLIQVPRGGRVSTRLIFRFKDGSIRDETAVYSQRQHFRLLSHHLVQKGPSFKPPLDMSIDCASGRVVVRYTDDDGKQKVEDERLELPTDLANGLILTLLKNIRGGAVVKELSMVAPTPKPRLVKLSIASEGEDRFTTGTAARQATHYVVKVEIGGLAGIVAPLIGKQPPDSHVWILGGEAPAFVKSEGPLFLGGPLWRIELVSPVFARGQSTATTKK